MSSIFRVRPALIVPVAASLALLPVGPAHAVEDLALSGHHAPAGQRDDTVLGLAHGAFANRASEARAGSSEGPADWLPRSEIGGARFDLVSFQRPDFFQSCGSCGFICPELFLTTQDGNGTVDATMQQNTVVIGEPIELSLEGEFQTTDDKITPDAINKTLIGIAGFNATAAACNATSNCPAVLDDFSSQQDIQFYFTKPSDAVTNSAIFHCPDCYFFASGVGNSNKRTLTATFNVLAPTNVTVTATPGEVSIVTLTSNTSVPPVTSQNPFLSSGNPLDDQFGMQFQASAVDLPNYTGMFQWVQVIKTFKSVTTGHTPLVQLTTTRTNCLTGLDNSFPFGTASQGEADGILTATTNDMPSIELLPNVFSASVNSTFRMYLMWMPLTHKGVTITSATPVTLGFVDWKFTGYANRKDTASA
jgi:hypothetical protein